MINEPEYIRTESEHEQISHELARECIVLLENDGMLPLRGKKIALYGSGARNTVRGGTGSGDVNVRRSISIEDGLKRAGISVTTGNWLEKQDTAETNAGNARLEKIRERAAEYGIDEMVASFVFPVKTAIPAPITEEDIRKSDTDCAVYVISRCSGEGSDREYARGDYLLYEEEAEQIKQLASAYPKLCVVLNIGGQIDLSEISGIEGVNALILMGQLGQTGGDALADILTGACSPSGKLTNTWAYDYMDYPSSRTFGRNDGDVDDEPYEEGIYVGYRYFDTFGVRPVYSFGYGLSYTSFCIETVGVGYSREAVRVTAQVTNTGEYPGCEVVQIYCSAPDGKLSKPCQELKAYAKSRLLAHGEQETLSIDIRIRDLASYSPEDEAWILEEGEYILRVGNSSRDTVPAAVIRCPETIAVSRVRNALDKEGWPQEIDPPEVRGAYTSGESADPHDLPVISIAGGDIAEEIVSYEQDEQADAGKADGRTITAEDVNLGKFSASELAAQLTIAELADFCVGGARSEGGSVVGNASEGVPGAAGDTSSIAYHTRGVRSLIMADGPAGIRIDPVQAGEGLGEYHYCTSIPVGWSIAHSWNIPLIEKAADMIGCEMEEFGIDIWLAPALNIHRNPLCGRNFEYYSEDPVISGMTATAITRGVQSHKGRSVTIKHFALNSQEDNRFCTNSIVSERALREIYLKGFEIAVKNASPNCVMSSYNLINGIHAANRRELLTDILRHEWGFCGFVMTDWFATLEQKGIGSEGTGKYGVSSPAGCIYAGNDVMMPGCMENLDEIIRVAESREADDDGYIITAGDLRRSATRVIRAAIFTY